MLVTDLFYDFVRILLVEIANMKMPSGIEWVNISNLITTPSSYLCRKNNCRHEGFCYDIYFNIWLPPKKIS